MVEGLANLGRRITVQTIDVPFDCTDGFLAAYWRRPHRYLDIAVRAGMSGVASLPDAVVKPALARLADDLRSGSWHRRHGALLKQDSLDVGYRLVIAS